jgi:hypothetical protein
MLELETIQANWGQAYGIRLDEGAVASVFLNIDKIRSAFSLRHLDEFFMFQQIWISSLTTKSKELTDNAEMPAVKKPESSGPSLQEWLSLFLHTRIHRVKVEADLGQSIGKVQGSINNIFGRFGFPGRYSDKEGKSFVDYIVDQSFSVAHAMHGLQKKL